MHQVALFSLFFFCLQPTGLKKKIKSAEHFLASPYNVAAECCINCLLKLQRIFT